MGDDPRVHDRDLPLAAQEEALENQLAAAEAYGVERAKNDEKS